MLLLSALLSLHATLPPVVAGPDLAESAKTVDAPIATVTVYSDRARVRRRAILDVEAGTHVLRLPDLHGALMLDTLRFTVRPGKVIRVEAAPVMRDRISIDQVDRFIEELEALTDQVALVDAEAQAINSTLSLLVHAAPAPLVPEDRREGRPAQAALPEAWGRSLEFLVRDRAKARDRLRALADVRRERVEKIVDLQQQIQRLNLGGFSDRAHQVLAIIESPGGRVVLELEYFATGASWRPAYDLDYDPSREEVAMDTVGVVSQATGEDWDGVGLELSTAIPGQSIALPRLLTWTLGEAKEFVPRPRAKPRAEAPTTFPSAATPSQKEIERSARSDSLRARVAALLGMAQSSAEELVATKTANLRESDSRGDRDRVDGGPWSSRRSLPPAPPASASPRVKDGPWGQKSESGASSVVQPSVTEAPSPKDFAFEAPPEIAEDYARSAPDTSGTGFDAPTVRRPGPSEARLGARAAATSLALFEPPTPGKQRFDDATLPAVVAGGLDYVYEARTRVHVKSTGESVRVPLGRERIRVKTRYRAAPAIEPVAYLEATVANQSDRPILRGPLQIFVRGDFSGEGELETTGPGGTITLPLGADEDIRLLRKVIPKSERSGLIHKDDVTLYRVLLEVANYKGRTVEVTVSEPLPRTFNDDIEIDLVKMDPTPSAGPDDDGILHWDVGVVAKKTKTIELEYRITRPADWQLHQR